MFLNDEEINKRLESGDNLINRLSIHKLHNNAPGPTIPDELKKVVTILTNEGERGKDIAKAFGMKEAEVGHIKNGIRGSDEVRNLGREVRENVSRDRQDAESKAISAVIMALDILPDKIKNVGKATELTSIARDLSQIANQMAGKDEGSGSNVTHLHIYAPRTKSVKEYETIDIG